MRARWYLSKLQFLSLLVLSDQIKLKNNPKIIKSVTGECNVGTGECAH